jgi:hypothetical protein
VAGLSRDRGVATPTGYALNVVVALLLVGGLVAGVAGTVAEGRETVAETELEVVGQRLAADLSAVDRLARVSDGGTVRLGVSLPRRVAGLSYRLRLQPADKRLVLATTDPAVTVTIPLETTTPLEASTQRGGPASVRYDGSTIRLGDPA